VLNPIDSKYLTDWSGLARGTPAELQRPRDTAEVAEVVRRCNQQNPSITVQGGLTGLAGGAVPGEGDVVLNLERMNAIEHIDDREGIMVVQAGTIRDSVLGIEAVLADGTVLDSMTRLVKNSAGLDLRFLFIGSEGTPARSTCSSGIWAITTFI